MIRLHTIVDYVSVEPFRPFRIKMASGQSYDVRHPELIMFNRSKLRIYTATGLEADTEPHWHDLSMLLIEAIEPLEGKSSASCS